jgi:isopentenyl diphosphate isomerase/L-lactate dehydrogenase-like FMN-dependent dehydrogenase
MEATAPPPPPEQPSNASRGGRSPFIVIAVVAILATFVFAAISIDLAGTRTCEDVRTSPATEPGMVECVNNKALVVISSGITAVLSAALAVVAIGAARTGTASPLLRGFAIAAAAAAVITFLV